VIGIIVQNYTIVNDLVLFSEKKVLEIGGNLTICKAAILFEIIIKE